MTGPIQTIATAVITLLMSLGTMTGLAAADEAPNPRVGINLNDPSDWNTELPFVDVFRQSRPWISQQEGKGWGQGPELALDEHGWVTRLEPGCYAETLLCTIDDGHYPGGRYHVFYEGEGTIEFSRGATVVEREPGHMIIEVRPDRGMFMRITETNPDNYIRNIRVIMPGFEDTYQENPFHPVFLERWRGFAAVRFMDWMHTNNSEISTWDERPKVEDASWMPNGVPLEIMIDYANRVEVAPWFCMPHLADDDYVRRFAEMVKERLDPSLNVYVEYSNEVWNARFVQARYAMDKGMELGLADKRWAAGWHYYAKRSVEVFEIWHEVFGDEKDRVVRVLSTQAANPFVAGQITGYENAGYHADALGVAPYFGLLVREAEESGQRHVSLKEAEGMTVEEFLDRVEAQVLPFSIDIMRRNQEVAARYGLKMVGYEGGQHNVAVGPAMNSDKVTAMLHEANRHPRMGQMYKQYLDAWAAEGGDVMCLFASIGKWTKWGSWGLAEYYDTPPSEMPKYQATLEWAAKRGQPVTMNPLEAATTPRR